MPQPPAPDVVQAFGGDGVPQRLDGGRGQSWSAGSVVLKPADESDDPIREWLERIVRPALRDADLRIALPVAARDGSLRYRGWQATLLLEGGHPTGRWHERADIARRFARAVENVDPATLPRRRDPWARADLAAWGELPGPLTDHPVARRLLPLERRTTVVHGDAAGNTLVHGRLPPAVIDLSLYARPVEWSVAVLALDVVAFEGAPTSLLHTISPDPEFPQLLARALLFRLTTDVFLGGKPDAAYSPVVDAVLAMTS